MGLRTFISLFCPFFLPFSLIAQNLEWERNFGGSDNDACYSVETCVEGGYVLAGVSASSDSMISGNMGSGDLWIVEIDEAGSLEWEQNFGGSDVDGAYSIEQTSDKGYIVAGASRSSDGDLSGNNGSSDYWILKLDSLGNMEWERNYGGDTLEVATSVHQTSDGGYIVGGLSFSSTGDVSGNKGLSDFWLLKLDPSGNLEWEQNYGGSSVDGHDNASNMISVLETSDGGYIAAGPSKSSDGDVSGNNGSWDYWVVKLDPMGNIEWEQNYGGGGDDGYNGVCLEKTQGGGYMLAGGSDSYFGGDNIDWTDYWVLKLDASGNIIWDRNYGGTDWDDAQSIHRASNGNYLLTGRAQSGDSNVTSNYGSSDFWVLEVDPSGVIQWEQNYGGSSTDWGYSIDQGVNGDLIVGGASYSSDSTLSENFGSSDYWAFKLALQGSGLSEKGGRSSFMLHPNPTQGQLRIDLGRESEGLRIKIRDLTGRTLKSQKVGNTRSFKTSIEGDPGIYFVELETEDGRRAVRKVVKE